MSTCSPERKGWLICSSPSPSSNYSFYWLRGWDKGEYGGTQFFICASALCAFIESHILFVKHAPVTPLYKVFRERSVICRTLNKILATRDTLQPEKQSPILHPSHFSFIDALLVNLYQPVIVVRLTFHGRHICCNSVDNLIVTTMFYYPATALYFDPNVLNKFIPEM